MLVVRRKRWIKICLGGKNFFVPLKSLGETRHGEQRANFVRKNIETERRRGRKNKTFKKAEGPVKSFRGVRKEGSGGCGLAGKGGGRCDKKSLFIRVWGKGG